MKPESVDTIVHVKAPKLTLEQAERLVQLPLSCIMTEYPNKLGQTIAGADELLSPRTLHPAFYGCFDWHSAVHGHWSLVKILKLFPEISQADTIRMLLKENISKENILIEVAYFDPLHNASYERTYGWAWVLKLSEELHIWDDPDARILEENLKPLTELISTKYVEFLPKLVYPIRVGEHTNTAFGLSFAWDYGQALNDTFLLNGISAAANRFYLNDVNCPLGWEPSGYDFLSPCLEEINLMRRVLEKEKFDSWMKSFLPGLADPTFDLAPGVVSDRTDGKLVHLDGLNFSRAWVLYGLSKQYPEYDHLKNVANIHMNYSLPNLVGDAYEGGHWLATFALYALDQNNEK